MDWEKFVSDVAAAATAAFSSVMSENASERFYAFALYTDGDGETIGPSANSIERHEAVLDKTGETDALSIAAYKWATAEWAYEAWKGEFFKGVYRDLANHRNALPKVDVECECTPGVVVTISGLPDEIAESYKRAVHQSMIAALKRMDEDGFFAQGRDDVTLFVSSSDDDEAFDLENESAQQLNPERVYLPFLERYEVAAADKSIEDDHAARAEESGVSASSDIAHAPPNPPLTKSPSVDQG